MDELRERQKAEAVKRMKKLGIMEQPIKEFEEEGKLNLSENGGFLYWLNDGQKEMVEKFEKEHNSLVYHVIHQFTNIGEMYSLLYVSEYVGEWERDANDIGEGQALAYVINMSMPDCSEFGFIGIQPSIGGVTRIL